MSSPPPEDAVCITARVVWIPPHIDTTGNPLKRKFSNAQDVANFTVFARPSDNLSVVWQQAEKEFTKAYAGEKVDLRYFSHMKVNSADVFPYHRVDGYFKKGRAPDENVLYFIQFDYDRESSIPVNSSLRPSWFTPPASHGTALKRRKVHGAENGMTVNEFDADRPVESNEHASEGARDDEGHVQQPRFDADGFAVPAHPASRKILPAKPRRKVDSLSASQATVLVQDSQAQPSATKPLLATHPMWLKKDGAPRQQSAPLVHSSPTESAASRAKTSVPQSAPVNQPRTTSLTITANRGEQSNGSRPHSSIPTPPSFEETTSDPYQAPTSAQRHSSRPPQSEHVRNYFRRTSFSDPNNNDPIVDDDDLMNDIADEDLLNGMDDNIIGEADNDYVPPGTGHQRGRSRSRSLETIPPQQATSDAIANQDSDLPPSSSLPKVVHSSSADVPSSSNAFNALRSSQSSRSTLRGRNGATGAWSKTEDIALLTGLKKNMDMGAIIKAFKLDRTKSSCRNHKAVLLQKFPGFNIPRDHEYYRLIENASATASVTPGITSSGTATPASALVLTSDPPIVTQESAKSPTAVPSTDSPALEVPVAEAPLVHATITTSPATVAKAAAATVNVFLATASPSKDPFVYDVHGPDSPIAILSPRETSTAPELDASQLKKTPGIGQTKLSYPKVGQKKKLDFKNERKKRLDAKSTAALGADDGEKTSSSRAKLRKRRKAWRPESVHGEEDYVMSGGLGLAENHQVAEQIQAEQPPVPSNEEVREEQPQITSDGEVQEELPNQSSNELAQDELPDFSSFEETQVELSNSYSNEQTREIEHNTSDNAVSDNESAEAPAHSPARSERSLTDSEKDILRDVDAQEGAEGFTDPVANEEQPIKPADTDMADLTNSRPSTAGSGPGKQLSFELELSARTTPEQSLKVTPIPQAEVAAKPVVIEPYDLRTYLTEPTADGMVKIGRPEHPAGFAVNIIQTDKQLLQEAKQLHKKKKYLIPLQFEINHLAQQSYIAMCGIPPDVEEGERIDKRLKPRQVFMELKDRGKFNKDDDFDEWFEQFEDDTDWNAEWQAVQNEPPSDFDEFEDCDDGYGGICVEDKKTPDSVEYRGEAVEVYSEDEGPAQDDQVEVKLDKIEEAVEDEVMVDVEVEDGGIGGSVEEEDERDEMFEDASEESQTSEQPDPEVSEAAEASNAVEHDTVTAQPDAEVATQREPEQRGSRQPSEQQSVETEVERKARKKLEKKQRRAAAAAAAAQAQNQADRATVVGAVSEQPGAEPAGESDSEQRSLRQSTASLSNESRLERKKRRKQERAQRQAEQGLTPRPKTKRRRSGIHSASRDRE